MCHQAPACKAVLAEATERWPNRSKVSDGICASSSHTSQNPNSDHEPNVIYQGKGYATAVDLTDDKTSGCDADAWAEHLRTSRDPRVKYVICNERMFSSYATSTRPAWTWGPYTGANPHDKHTHLSILPAALNDVSTWFPEPPEEDYMPLGTDINDDRRAQLRIWFDQYLGRGFSSVDEQNLHLYVFATKGMDRCLAGIMDSAEAKAYRLKRTA